MYKNIIMHENLKYIKQPFALAILGAIVYYMIELFDCYVNARKTSSLNRRTTIVFIILLFSLYFITIEENLEPETVFTDLGSF